ncbi:amino acid ABC transporter permease [Anaerosalibacter massiliensis]|uniref:Amino acid ABC transporter permease n=1 Tax=Anaerosalibacter massiliensis TaxID=1347392 RepID=A0A9X2S411_9FIRM|nr:amino acid ABC transporter permease [Anaerosalibacter massiliensis]MCR2043003.1 amino acid ABC transporter permease [Anaerosalibacter massiliensis]
MDFSFLKNYYMFFLEGAKITLLLAILTIFFGVIFGILLALMRISHNPILKTISAAYIEFIRGTPIMVQLFIVYYGLSFIGITFPDINVLGSSFPDLMAGVTALSINSAAYVAEIVRAGIQAVDKGQMEASRSLGLTYFMSMKSIILPQAIKNVLPALGNEFIAIIKESSIVSIIGIHELMYNTDMVRGNTFKPFEPLIVTAGIYFIITFSLSTIVRTLERRLKTSD